MKVNGNSIKPRVRVSSLTLMAKVTKVNGLRTNSMAKELRSGKTVLYMLEHITKGASMAMVSSLGLMGPSTRVTSTTTTFKGMVSTHGQTDASISANGRPTRWRETARCSIQTAGATRGDSSMTRSMAEA